MRIIMPHMMLILFLANPVLANRTRPPSKAELDQITQRGKMLVEYDIAAWHGTDAVRAMNPPEGTVKRYIAKKSDNVWTVAFGRLNEKQDRFLIMYEATQGIDSNVFSVKKHETPKEDTDFILSAAKAIEVSMADFKMASRPYNVAVLPEGSNRIYVYLYPAQTKQGIFPLGSDVRYLVSKDNCKIIEKRQLHISIIEFSSPPDIQKVEGSYHTAVLDDIPEDTDVFHVLSRKPSVPELVATKKYVFQIETNGTINHVMTTEAFLKMKGK